MFYLDSTSIQRHLLDIPEFTQRVEWPSSEVQSPAEWAQHFLLDVEVIKSVFLLSFPMFYFQGLCQ